MLPETKNIPADLGIIQKRIFDACNYSYSVPEPEAEGRAYGACRFMLNDRPVVFRISKITPAKSGQFVTLWKRFLTGETAPLDASDHADLFIISCRKRNNFGQFIFPKADLVKNGILSVQSVGGKRGFRIYPAWDGAENKQAQTTQRWQSAFFFDFSKPEVSESQLKKLIYLTSGKS